MERTARWSAISHAGHRRRSCVSGCVIWRMNAVALGIIDCSCCCAATGDLGDQPHLPSLPRGKAGRAQSSCAEQGHRHTRPDPGRGTAQRPVNGRSPANPPNCARSHRSRTPELRSTHSRRGPKLSWRAFRAREISRRPSAMGSPAGRHLNCFSRTAASGSTTIRPSAPCARLASGGKTGSSPVPTAAGNPRPGDDADRDGEDERAGPASLAF